MSANIDNVLTAAIEVTAKHDKRSLDKALTNAIVDLFRPTAVLLLNINKNKGFDYLELAYCSPSNTADKYFKTFPNDFGRAYLEPDHNIHQCLLHASLISNSETSRLTFPILVDKKLQGVLDIYGLTAENCSFSNIDKLIKNLLRIYENCQSIIDDSERDTLTGLLNRKSFNSKLNDLIANAVSSNDQAGYSHHDRREKELPNQYWLGMLDIDHFKQINDNFGHAYGDEVLLLFANLMRNTFRSTDLIFRHGGEEFIVVIRGKNELDAMAMFERFRQGLEQKPFPQIGQVKASIGMAKIDANAHPYSILECADKALYYAKEHGRNQVCNYNRLIASGALLTQQIDGDIELF